MWLNRAGIFGDGNDIPSRHRMVRVCFAGKPSGRMLGGVRRCPRHRATQKRVRSRNIVKWYRAGAEEKDSQNGS